MFTLSKIEWPSVTFSVPESQIFVEAKYVAPDLSGAPGDIGLSVDDAVLVNVSASLPAISEISVLSPPIISIDDLIVSIPEIDVSIPPSAPQWVYAAFDELILHSVEIQTRYLDGQIGVVWDYAGEMIRNIWTDNNSIVLSMGWIDVLAQSRRRECDYGSGVYSGESAAIKENFRVRSSRTRVSVLLDSEKQKRTHYADRQSASLDMAKEIVTKSRDGYNLAVQQFAAMIAGYQVASSRFQALIQTNEARVKEFSTQIAAEKAKGAITRSMVSRYNAQLSVNKSLISIYEIQMQLAKREVDAVALKIDTFRATVDDFTTGLQAISEESKQIDTRADIAMVMSKIKASSGWIKELESRQYVLDAELSSGKSSEYDQTIVNESRNILVPAEIASEEASNVAETKNLSLQLSRIPIEGAAQLSKQAYTRTLIDGQSYSSSVNVTTNRKRHLMAEEREAQRESNSNLRAAANIMGDAAMARAKEKASSILRKANITSVSHEFVIST